MRTDDPAFDKYLWDEEKFVVRQDIDGTIHFTNLNGVSTMKKFILINSGSYGQKLAIPFSEQVLDAIMSAKTVNQEYDSEINGYHLYVEDRKVDISIVGQSELEIAPMKKDEEIKLMEAEREKALKHVEEMNQRINEKRSA